MCGIAGFYNYRPDNPDRAIKAAISSLKHRGPDAEGYFYDENKAVGLVHTRLSIIDLSPEANQPFYSADKRYIIILNGEIYNYKQLRKELEEKYLFKTNSDTEVLLALYLIEKENLPAGRQGCLQKLNGMFAFAIYDTVEDEIFIARDRIGKKPLFYSFQNNAFVFGSEIKAILQLCNSVSRDYDMEAIHSYLHLGYIPEPSTVYQSIKKFPSGCFLQLKKNGPIDFKRYWSLPLPESNPSMPARMNRSDGNYADSKNQLKSLLFDSVKLRLNADVPFGAFLSGGTDSSLVSAMAMQSLTKPLQTFSIGFEDSKFDESIYAKKVAERLETDHTELIITEAEMQKLLPQIIDVFDEPFADSSAIPTMMVSKLAAEKVKMVITGDGGDELFLGYGMYNWSRRLANPLLWNFRKLIAAGLSLGDARMKRAAEVFRVPSKKSMYPHIFSQEQYLFSAKEISFLMKEDAKASESLLSYELFNQTTQGEPLKITPAQLHAWYDIQFYLKDDLLVKVDRSTMRFGLEARSPLLDYRIVEFAQKLPEEFKWKGDVQKFILKDILYNYLPKELMDRPKWGFSIPMTKWLRKDWSMYKEKYLIPLTKNDLFDSVAVNYYIRQFENGNDNYYNRIWSLIVLQQFLGKNN